MKNNKRNISIKGIIIFVFLIAMLITIGTMGCLIFRNWLLSVEKTSETISVHISENIYDQISSFMHVPSQINEANYKIIENDILNLNNERLRDKFFAGVLDSYDNEIYSFSYGTANGEYYGARRTENGVLEIMRNNASTGGNSWYYSMNEDFTAGQIAVKAGKFDPRTREWYKAAEAAGSPTLSPVYKHFVMDDLAISAAWPIYGRDGKLRGVMGTHMLLSGIGKYLEDTVQRYQGYAFIVEKDSGNLIANSIGADNFTVLEDDTFKRSNIADMTNHAVRKAYEEYKVSHAPYFHYKSDGAKFYANAKEIRLDGVDWIVISAIPDGLLMTNVVDSIRMTVLLVVLALIFSTFIYYYVAGRLLKPIDSLLDSAEAWSAGDFSKRADVVRNDEIGIISASLNRVAEEMKYLVNNLETNVNERTEALNEANLTLEESKNQLRLILDSAAEAIYGIDTNGNCTFCNTSCIRILGYKDQSELLGKNMHDQIHYKYADGTPMPAEECRIFKAFKEKKGSHVDDEVFWRADGTSFDVEYHSYPQVRNGEVVGAVINFMDITDRKQREAKIQYLSCHDTLTGLYNRRCIENNLMSIDNPEHLPMSVIFADINGLKMTNDIFGHAAGDELIIRSAEILVQSCGENDLIARVGGDEFIIILSNTNEENAKKTLSRIHAGFSNARVAAIKCSISLGLDIKISPEQSLQEVITNAENAMYKDKTMNRKSVNKGIIDAIVDTLHSRSSIEKQHALIVSDLCGELGADMHLSETETSKLKRAGYLHDIGKIILDEKILNKEVLTGEELEKIRQHSVVGYRILNLFDDTLDLAEYVYGHHERWDGKGYPRGLSGEQIPLISRIISIVETYERVLNKGNLSLEEAKSMAIETIIEGAGTQFDPQVAALFARMIER